MSSQPRFMPSIESSLEFAMRFNAWTKSLSTPLTVERIQDHWEVSRATSYRWLRAYRKATEAFSAPSANAEPCAHPGCKLGKGAPCAYAECPNRTPDERRDA